MGETEAALAVYKNSRKRHPHWELQERDWLDLIEALTEQDRWGDAAYVMRDYLKDVAEPSPRVRLKLAQVLIQKLSRPAQGLKLLQEIPEGPLPAKLDGVRQKLVEQAQHILEEGELELQDEMW